MWQRKRMFLILRNKWHVKYRGRDGKGLMMEMRLVPAKEPREAN